MRERDSRRGSAAGWVRAASGVVAAGMAAAAWVGSLPLRAGAQAAAPAASGSAPGVFTVATPEGPLRITALGHASLMFQWNGRVIHVDPWSRVADYSSVPRADQVWITHDHADHLDLDALRAVVTPSTRLVVDGRSAQRLAEFGGRLTVLQNWESTTVDGVRVDAVPAYNVVRERSPGVKYHPRGWYNGYVATFGGKRIYIAGDTECIPEMGRLGRVDVAFLPINLPFTMPPEEAVGCIKVIAPRTVVPYHQGDSDPAVVARALQNSGIEVLVFRLP
ncbi:MAG TPA: MBL fold metallo-hydrolase [Limnochordales bacterium]